MGFEIRQEYARRDTRRAIGFGVSESLPTRRPIRVMTPLVASQIAAGEVVERPASIVKELIENSIDAGATRIEVELEQGGIELVRVTDDGSGIADSELGLAIMAHATSKIDTSEDLDHIATMGFRGEALASIASVSRITIRSRTAGQDHAAEIFAEGDAVRPVKPASGPRGTSVSVRNLFFNTPARRKFLRTPGTEQGRCMDVVRQIAMAHPGIAFVVKHDGRESMDVTGGVSPRERCLAILGEELASELIEIGDDAVGSSGVTLWGLIGKPSIARATASAQYIYVNGRIVRDRTLQHAVKEAYRGLIEPGRYPTAVLMLEMPPSVVDVNVHPSKAEVRFRDSSLVHQTVLRAVRNALRAHDLTPSVDGKWGEGATGNGRGSGFNAGGIMPAPGAARSGLELGEVKPAMPARYVNPSAFVEQFRRWSPVSAQSSIAFDDLRRAVQAADAVSSSMEAGTRSASDAQLQSASHPGASAGSDPGATGGLMAPTNGAEVASRTTEELLDASPTSGALQIHNSFLITQDQHGVVIIDQHALHERVMFEKLLARIGGGQRSQGTADADQPAAAAATDLESQRLLIPETVDASPRQMEALNALRPLLKRLGIEVEPIGPTSVAIQAFSSFLIDRRVEAGAFVGEVLDRAVEQGWDLATQGTGPSVNPVANSGPTDTNGVGVRNDTEAPMGQEAVLHEVLDMMACKAAVKAGDRLSERELGDLLRLRELVERSSNCPHGRPTSIRLTISELEKRFGRA